MNSVIQEWIDIYPESRSYDHFDEIRYNFRQYECVNVDSHIYRADEGTTEDLYEKYQDCLTALPTPDESHHSSEFEDFGI